MVSEGVQHWRFGETDLPLILHEQVFFYDFALSALFEVEFAVPVLVLVVSAHFVFLGLLDPGELLRQQELAVPPFSGQIFELILGRFEFVGGFFRRELEVDVFDDLGKFVAVERFIERYFELCGSVVLYKRRGVVPFPSFAHLLHRLEVDVVLYTFEDGGVLFALEIKSAELGVDFDDFLLLELLEVERFDIALRDDQLESLAKRVPGLLLKDESKFRNVEHSLVLLLFGTQFAVMLGVHLLLYHLALHPAAPHLRLYHVFQPRLLLLQQQRRLFHLHLVYERHEGRVEVWLRALVQQVFVSGVLFEDGEGFAVDGDAIEDVYPVFLLLEQLVEVLVGGFLEDGFVETFEVEEVALVLLLLALLELDEDLLELVEALGDAGLEAVEFVGADGLFGKGPFLDPHVVLQDDVGPPFKGVQSLSFVLQDLLHLLVSLLHVFADLLQRLLLPLNQVQAQLKRLGVVRPEVFPKPLLIALHSIVSEAVFFDLLVGLLVLVVALPLQL